MKTKVNRSAMIRNHLAYCEPDVTDAAIAKELKNGITKNLVNKVRSTIRLKILNGKRLKKGIVSTIAVTDNLPKQPKGEEFYCAIQIPVAGATIKLSTKAKGMIGTLGVSQEGFTFIKAKAKKPTGRNLSWDRLAKLFESGLI